MGFFSKFFGISDDSDDEVVNVTAVTTVIKILKHLYKARTPITLLFDNIPTQYTTMILEISSNENYFTIDELTPSSGNKLMKERAIFHATSSDHGITVKFDGKALSTGIENNIAYYKISIPSNLDYQQKRDAYRTSLPIKKNLSLSFKASSKQIFFGYLTDLSLTGCRVRFEHNISDDLKLEECIKGATLKIDEKKNLLVDIEIRHVRYDGAKRHTIVGCRFVDLNIAGENMITHFISGLQREERRKKNDSR